MPYQYKAIALENAAGPIDRTAGEAQGIAGTGGLYIKKAPALPGVTISFDEESQRIPIEKGDRFVRCFEHFTIWHGPEFTGSVDVVAYEAGESIDGAAPPGFSGGPWYSESVFLHRTWGNVGIAAESQGMVKGGAQNGGPFLNNGAGPAPGGTIGGTMWRYKNRTVIRYQSTPIVPGPVNQRSQFTIRAFSLPLEPSTSLLFRELPDRAVHRFIWDVAFSGIGILSTTDNCGVFLSPNNGGSNMLTNGVGFGVLMGGTGMFLLARVNAGPLFTLIQALPWPGPITELTRVELRILPATASWGILQVLLNDRVVASHQFTGAVTRVLPLLTDNGPNPYGWVAGMGNHSAGAVDSMYCAHFRAEICPAP